MSHEIIDHGPIQRRFTLRLIAALVVMLLLGIALAAWFVEHSRSRSAQLALDAQIAAMRAEGLPVAFSELDPRAKGQSTRQGELLLKLLHELPELASQFQVPEHLLQWHPKEFPEHLEPFRAALVASRPQRERILHVIREEPIYLPCDYSAPQTLSFENAHILIECGRQLSADQSLCLLSGDYAQAEQRVLDTWDLASALEHDPFLQWGRRSLMGTALDDAQELLSRTDMSETWRNEWERRLIVAETTIRAAPEVEADAARSYSYYGWLRQAGLRDRMTMLRGWGLKGKIMSLTAMLDSNLAREQTETLAWAQQTVRWIDEPGQAMPNYLAMESQYVRKRALLARIALRIDRHYRQQGQFPEQLEDILDPLLRQTSLDLNNGQPLEYEHDQDYFLLRAFHQATQLPEFGVSYGH